MKLILPDQVADEIKARLSPQIQAVSVDDEGNLSSDASDAEIYLSWFSLKDTTLNKVLAAAPKLRWLHTPSAGVEHILTPTLQQRDIMLTNGAGIHAIPIAEFVLAFMLHHAKHFGQLKAAQEERHWLTHLELQELKEATVLIIGAGGIGQEIAVRASAFDMKVWGSRRHPQPQPCFERIVGDREWRSLLGQVDYVVMATPLTPETEGMFDEAALRAMHPGAYLINIARGAIVDEIALLKALQEHWIAGAALDTLSQEPLPPDSPFWSLENVFVTPHCSGESPKATQRSINLFLDNFERYCTGKPLRNRVDRELGY